MKNAKYIFALALLPLATPSSAGFDGIASWYGERFAGRKTANGERFDPNKFTAAHKTLPFNTRVKVTHQNKSVVVRINDRGPHVRGRVIDLSRAAAQEIGIKRKGTGRVSLQVL